MGVMRNKHSVTVDVPKFARVVRIRMDGKHPKMSWADLSRRTGVLACTITQLHKHKRVPCLDAYLSICHALDIDPWSCTVARMVY